jgi:DNA-binding response OmpR family regulator
VSRADAAHRVLLVEDDAKLAGLLARALHEDGLRVERAATAEFALNLALGGGFDALVLDVLLPDGDGLALCARLRRSGVKAPALIVSAVEHPGEGQLRSAGANDFLAKPFALSDFVDRVARLIDRRLPALRRPT